MSRASSNRFLLLLLGATLVACGPSDMKSALPAPPSLRASIDQSFVFAEARALAAVDELSRAHPAVHG